MLPQWISSSRTVQQLEVFKQRLWISLSLSGQQLEVSFLSQRIWWSLTGQKLEVFKLPQWKYFAFSFVHRRAAPARFAAIPTWRRRWTVGALGARFDVYTLRRTEAALVLHNGLCHSHKRQWYGRMQSTSRREKKEDGSRETKTQWGETTGKQTSQQQQGLAQAAEGRIRNKIISLLFSLFSR